MQFWQGFQRISALVCALDIVPPKSKISKIKIINYDPRKIQQPASSKIF